MTWTCDTSMDEPKNDSWVRIRWKIDTEKKEKKN